MENWMLVQQIVAVFIKVMSIIYPRVVVVAMDLEKSMKFVSTTTPEHKSKYWKT